MTKSNLDKAYQHCQHIATSHYENFPVASRLLPTTLRRPFTVVYAFARTADDIADEGDMDKATRLESLSHYADQLDAIARHQNPSQDPIFIALEDVIHTFNVPIILFHDLLSAFKQDVAFTPFISHADILHYCQRSANPVGRILLHLVGQTASLTLLQSDSICSALQLINFYQDIEQDLVENNRIYLDQEMLDNAGITDFAITPDNSEQLARPLREKYDLTAQLIEQGLPLGQTLSGRFAWQIRFTILAALLMLFILSMQDDKRLFSRPRFKKWQLLKPASAALSYSSYDSYARYLIFRIKLINQQKR